MRHERPRVFYILCHMIYFSEIKSRKVFTEDNIYVGRLNDVIFRAGDSPIITKIMLRARGGNQIVPITHVKRMDANVVVLEKNYEVAQLGENELYVRANLLDSQIIDITGDKMVRVNDVAIQQRPTLTIAGVDTSVLGIMRWFYLEDVFNTVLSWLPIRYTPRLLSWADIQTIELMRGQVKVKTEQTKLHKIRPEDLADYLEQTNVENIRVVLKTLDIERAADVVNNLNLNYQIELFKHEDPVEAGRIMSHMDSEEVADILLAMPRKKKQRMIEAIDRDVREEITYLLQMSTSPVGDILSVDYLTVDSSMSAREVLAHVKRVAHDYDELIYLYVLNDQQQMVGVFSLRALLIQHPQTPVYKFMRPQVETVFLSTPVSVVWRKLLKYKYYVLPVVDMDRHMLGLVKIDDVSEIMVGQDS